MVYFISGLGADERVFQFLKLPGVEKRFIKWVSPFHRESLSSYCKKLIDQIDPQQEIILIGISFGGIIAQELAKLVPCKKVIIISSVKSRAEFNWQLKLASNLQLHRIVPRWLLQLANQITANYYFDVRDKAEAKLLQQVIKDTDPTFLTWAIDRIMNWHEYDYLQNIIHIHGSIDKIFPIKYINNVIEIPNGGHFMIVNKADQLERLIFDKIKKD